MEFVKREYSTEEREDATMTGTTIMKRGFAIVAFSGFMAMGALAQSSTTTPPTPSPDVVQDQKDINHDRRDVHQDTRDIRQDRRDVAKDRKDIVNDKAGISNDKSQLHSDVSQYGANSSQAQADRKDIRADRRDVVADKKDIVSDKKDIHRDKKDRRHDRRDLHHDRVDRNHDLTKSSGTQWIDQKKAGFRKSQPSFFSSPDEVSGDASCSHDGNYLLEAIHNGAGFAENGSRGCGTRGF